MGTMRRLTRRKQHRKNKVTTQWLSVCASRLPHPELVKDWHLIQQKKRWVKAAKIKIFRRQTMTHWWTLVPRRENACCEISLLMKIALCVDKVPSTSCLKPFLLLPAGMLRAWLLASRLSPSLRTPVPMAQETCIPTAVMALSTTVLHWIPLCVLRIS